MATIRATKQIPLDSIQPHPENPNQGDVGAITQSLKHHGQYRAIVVSEATGNIVAGNHTYLAAKANGETKILAHLIPNLSLEDEKRIMVADNQYARLATSDDALLVDLLTELAKSQDGLIATGYDGDDLDDLLRQINSYGDFPTDPNGEWVGMPGFDQPDRQAAFSVTIHFPTHDDADEFFSLIDRDRSRSMWWPASDGHVGSNVNVAYVADE